MVGDEIDVKEGVLLAPQEAAATVPILGMAIHLRALLRPLSQHKGWLLILAHLDAAMWSLGDSTTHAALPEELMRESSLRISTSIQPRHQGADTHPSNRLLQFRKEAEPTRPMSWCTNCFLVASAAHISAQCSNVRSRSEARPEAPLSTRINHR